MRQPWYKRITEISVCRKCIKPYIERVFTYMLSCQKAVSFACPFILKIVRFFNNLLQYCSFVQMQIIFFIYNNRPNYKHLTVRCNVGGIEQSRLFIIKKFYHSPNHPEKKCTTKFSPTFPLSETSIGSTNVANNATFVEILDFFRLSLGGSVLSCPVV